MKHNNLAIRLVAFFGGISTILTVPSAVASLADQVPGWSVSADGSIYDGGKALLTTSGDAILIKKHKTSGITTLHHYDSEGDPHSSYPLPVSLNLAAYPTLSISPNSLIPLGGTPASFLVGATIANGGVKYGFCRIVFGRGLSTDYGALGFLETPLGDNVEYLGRIDGRIFLSEGAIDAQGIPEVSYGNFGRRVPLPVGAQELDTQLQSSGAILSLARKSSSAPTAYDMYLYRTMPNGHLDPMFDGGILIGRNSEAGLFSYSLPTEANGQFWFHKFFTNGVAEKYSLNPSNLIKTKVAEVTNLPSSSPWNTNPFWTFQTMDGRIGFTTYSEDPKFVCINANFTSSTSVPLPTVSPGLPNPLLPQQLPKSLIFPDFLLRKLHSYSGGNYTSTWLRFSGDQDSDGDGVADFAETGTGIFISLTDTGTSPTKSDTDGDGLSDLSEITKYSSNPNLIDSDNDGFTDFFEVNSGFSPVDPLSMPATIMQAVAAVELKISTRIGKTYRIETSPDLEVWSDSGIVVHGNGGEVRDVFSRADQSARFWRAVEVQP